MHLLGVLALEAQRGRRQRRRGLGHRGASPPARRPPSVRSASSTTRVVVDRAGGGDRRPRTARSGAAWNAAIRVDRRVADHGRAADDRPPERMVAEDGDAEDVEHRVLRVVLVHRDLLEHDLALGVDVVERRAPHHVGHHVERARQVLVEHPRVDGGRLLVGARVELGAHRVEQLVDLGRGVARPCRGTACARGSARAPPPRASRRASPCRRRSPGPRTARSSCAP